MLQISEPLSPCLRLAAALSAHNIIDNKMQSFLGECVYNRLKAETYKLTVLYGKPCDHYVFSWKARRR